jgi:predicted alpha/beta-fold hydrolase
VSAPAAETLAVLVGMRSCRGSRNKKRTLALVMSGTTNDEEEAVAEATAAAPAAAGLWTFGFHCGFRASKASHFCV